MTPARTGSEVPMKHHLARLLLAALALASAGAHAGTAEEPSRGAPPPGAGAEQTAASAPAATRQWLSAQARREQASRQRPVLSGDVLTRVQKRYEESFTTKSEGNSFHNSRSNVNQ